MKWVLILSFSLLVALCHAGFWQDVAEHGRGRMLSATRMLENAEMSIGDTFIREDRPNKNEGANVALLVRSKPGYRLRTLFDWGEEPFTESEGDKKSFSKDRAALIESVKKSGLGVVGDKKILYDEKFARTTGFSYFLGICDVPDDCSGDNLVLEEVEGEWRSVNYYTVNVMDPGTTHVFGNGNGYGVVGSGSGMTWNCAVDPNVANDQEDSCQAWERDPPDADFIAEEGGDYNTLPAFTVTDKLTYIDIPPEEMPYPHMKCYLMDTSDLVKNLQWLDVPVRLVLRRTDDSGEEPDEDDMTNFLSLETGVGAAILQTSPTPAP